MVRTFATTEHDVITNAYDEDFATRDFALDDLTARGLDRDEFERDFAAARPAKPQTAPQTSESAPRTGQHRAPEVPHALKGRAALIAVAAGAAVVAAGSALSDQSNNSTTATAAPTTQIPVQPASKTGTAGAATPGVVDASKTVDTRGFTNGLKNGERLANAAKARMQAALRPPFFNPVSSASFTSGYGARWGTTHWGIDLAAPIGTPIKAAADGVVVAAGPAAGFGNWIKIRTADNSINLYGHMYSDGVLVKTGQRVQAGDVIGLVGNNGQSTGPHVHFEVWRNGTTKIDPVPWLAKNGVRLQAYTG